MLVYIAGPMRGKKYFNFSAFDAAKVDLANMGHEPVSPADLDRAAGFDPMLMPEDSDWSNLEKCNFALHDAINRDIEAMKACGAIYMLRGWESSFGAKAEKALAEWMGLRVMYQEPEDVLEEALRITKGDRNVSYGSPVDDFARTAAMWTAIKGVQFEAKDVALFMIAVKLSREAHCSKRDNAIDIAGYARCLSLCQ
jgi:hypothetical protein